MITFGLFFPRCRMLILSVFSPSPILLRSYSVTSLGYGFLVISRVYHPRKIHNGARQPLAVLARAHFFESDA